jgi:hypothetical protein
MLAQRICGLAVGDVDLNHHEQLHNDPTRRCPDDLTPLLPPGFHRFCNSPAKRDWTKTQASQVRKIGFVAYAGSSQNLTLLEKSS